ncbi:MAG: COX15/CtaA family protein [Microbacteriaceae bacterium]
MNFLTKLVDSSKLRFYAIASLVSQIGLVVTGGLVRLTGSGLGCPTWPNCTTESLVTVPEMGIHGIIEFGNRVLTLVLMLIALGTLITVLRSKEGKQLRLRSMAVILLLGVPGQAVVGGISVLTKLNPWVVGLHFVLSGLLIAAAATLMFRVFGWSPDAVSPRWLSGLIVVFGWVTVLVGVAVTGAGPHSGDTESTRNGLDLEIWQHYHSYPGYILLALVVAKVVWLKRTKTSISTFSSKVAWLLLANVALQAIIGVLQARLGVPPLLVALHMFGAATAIALVTLQFNRAG